MLKKEKAFTGVDILLAVVVIIVFTTVIASLMYNIQAENLKIKNKLIANIYLIETLENIAITSYENVTSKNLSLFPEDMPDNFNKNIEVVEVYLNDADKQNIIKKVKVSISYKMQNKTYEETVERLKIKE